MVRINLERLRVIRHPFKKLEDENLREEKYEEARREEEQYSRAGRPKPKEFSNLLEEEWELTLGKGSCEGREIGEQKVGNFCEWNNDTVLCWPRTSSGTVVYLPCFEEFNGIKYDSSENASRYCFQNGTWSSSNYSLCLKIDGTISESEFEENFTTLTSLIYFVGYSVSVIALLIAIFIFLYFKDLRCLRNTIHTNLMFTYVMADFMWILIGILQNSLQADMTMCMVLPLLLHYFHVTTFFWMFVEGLYLYMLVVETFNRANIKAFVYFTVGWGNNAVESNPFFGGEFTGTEFDGFLSAVAVSTFFFLYMFHLQIGPVFLVGIPVIIIIIWGVVKATAPTSEEPVLAEFSGVLSHCHWMNGTIHNWIFNVPVLTVMALNCVFLVMIMWVLITKLRSANNAETQQYRKATKALLVLIPLLGITYILMIVSPTEGVVAQVFYNTRAFMLSFQGFLVALFYCFLNSEVQNTVRHRMESWRTVRTLADKRYNYSRDWSPRSRTESMRLNSQPTLTPYKKRESYASEVTTTTVVNSSAYSNNGNRVSNGSTTGTSFIVTPKASTPFLEVTNDD